MSEYPDGTPRMENEDDLANQTGFINRICLGWSKQLNMNVFPKKMADIDVLDYEIWGRKEGEERALLGYYEFKDRSRYSSTQFPTIHLSAAKAEMAAQMLLINRVPTWFGARFSDCSLQLRIAEMVDDRPVIASPSGCSLLPCNNWRRLGVDTAPTTVTDWKWWEIVNHYPTDLFARIPHAS